MNQRDLLLQKHLPTFMAPRFEPLPPLEEGQSRLLMAEDGLWIEAKTTWGAFVRRLFQTPRILPYGPIKERTELHCGSIPRSLLERFAAKANESADCGYETAAWILWSRAEGWEYLKLDIFKQTAGSVEFTWPELGPNRPLILDLHSHGNGPAFFSKLDDRSDQGAPHFSLVLGDCKGGRALSELQIAFRLCLSGFFFEEFDERFPWERSLRGSLCDIT